MYPRRSAAREAPAFCRRSTWKKIGSHIARVAPSIRREMTSRFPLPLPQRLLQAAGVRFFLQEIHDISMEKGRGGYSATGRCREGETENLEQQAIHTGREHPGQVSGAPTILLPPPQSKAWALASLQSKILPKSRSRLASRFGGAAHLLVRFVSGVLSGWWACLARSPLSSFPMTSSGGVCSPQPMDNFSGSQFRMWVFLLAMPPAC